MNQYRTFQNGHALNSLNKPIQTPEARLGVGGGEELAPLPHVVVYPNLPKIATIPDLQTASYEQASIDGFGEQVKQGDFPMTLYYGNAIEGV